MSGWGRLWEIVSTKAWGGKRISQVDTGERIIQIEGIIKAMSLPLNVVKYTKNEIYHIHHF